MKVDSARAPGQLQRPLLDHNQLQHGEEMFFFFFYVIFLGDFASSIVGVLLKNAWPWLCSPGRRHLHLW